MTPQEMAATHAAAFIGSRAWSVREFADLLANPMTIAAGDVGCFALARVVADEAELLTIACHPDHQRQGLAQQCMSTWHNLALHRGARRAVLEVAADNDAAISLYQKSGYVSVGKRPGYYLRSDGRRADAVLMACALS